MMIEKALLKTFIIHLITLIRANYPFLFKNEDEIYEFLRDNLLDEFSTICFKKEEKPCEHFKEIVYDWITDLDQENAEVLLDALKNPLLSEDVRDRKIYKLCIRFINFLEDNPFRLIKVDLSKSIKEIQIRLEETLLKRWRAKE